MGTITIADVKTIAIMDVAANKIAVLATQAVAQQKSHQVSAQYQRKIAQIMACGASASTYKAAFRSRVLSRR